MTLMGLFRKICNIHILFLVSQIAYATPVKHVNPIW
jgi:hypothetical protein